MILESLTQNGVKDYQRLKREIMNIYGYQKIFLFRDLEHNMEISYMSLYCHYGIWHEINNYYPDDISHKKGMQNYLKYCKKNDVTLDTIKKKFGNTHLPDVMQYLKKERKERER